MKLCVFFYYQSQKVLSQPFFKFSLVIALCVKHDLQLSIFKLINLELYICLNGSSCNQTAGEEHQQKLKIVLKIVKLNFMLLS